MAMSAADIEAFIEELQRNPQLRDRARNVILADDFLELPKIVARLGERVDQLGERIDQLGARIEQLVEVDRRLEARLEQVAGQLDQLVLIAGLHDGRLGNVEGSLFELRYGLRLPAKLGRWYHKVRAVHIPELDRVNEAFTSHELGDADWDDLLQLDAAAWANRRLPDRRTEDGDVLVVLELSKTVNAEDVRRVHRRAEILRKMGLDVDACVDGEQIRPDAKALANSLGVITLVLKDAAAA